VCHDLTVKNLMNQISICELLLKRNEIESFLKRLITGDQKWIMTIMYEKDRGRSKVEDFNFDLRYGLSKELVDELLGLIRKLAIFANFYCYY